MTAFRTRLAVLGAALALTAGVLAPVAAADGATPAPATEAHTWAALGDSYTAGAVPAAGDTFEVPRDGCERTDHSYPLVVERHLGPLVDLTDVSCGAATIDDITDRSQKPFGRQLPPFSTDPEYPFAGVPPQASAVHSGTDVITVGAGGNTLGFVGILLRCVQLGSARDGAGTPCRDALAAVVPERLAAVRRDYDRMLTLLHRRAPHARILAVGYPTIIPDDTSLCRWGDRTHFATLTRGDLDWLRQDVLEPLNETISRSAGAHDTARFVDLYDSSRGHGVCAADQWVEGLYTGSGQVALVHPNVRGHRDAARRVTAALVAAFGTPRPAPAAPVTLDP